MFVDVMMTRYISLETSALLDRQREVFENSLDERQTTCSARTH
jgi:hypothetical protein